MKKKIVTLFLTFALATSIVACGGNSKDSENKSEAKEEKEPTDLTGTWKSDENNGAWMEAVISDSTIEINWVSDDGDTKSIYWIGTYEAPTKYVEEYSWTSKRDKEKTDTALLASTDDTKEFTFKDDIISYEASALGTTKTIELSQVSKDTPKNLPVEKTAKDHSELTLDYLLPPNFTRWNMAAQEVRDNETREEDTLYSTVDNNVEYINYKPVKLKDKYASSLDSTYCFFDNQLKAYWCSYDKEMLSNPMNVYSEIKEYISNIYGECEAEEFTWSDTTYQNDQDKWNDAFRYGYVTVKTTWHTSDSAIIITWDYNNRMNVAISSLDFENNL
ncbi:hypothetical protein LIR45_01480 [Lachnospiraceae bacterium EP-SM-12S-S03]|nr:hypothetical protein [Lachnospiraceae bacterium EP-SM-12S-S03]